MNIPRKILTCLSIALAIIGNGYSLPTTMEKMTMSRMRKADLETSATGYSYNHQPGRPASYVQYTNHGNGGYYDAPESIQYITYRNPEVLTHSGPTVISSLPAFKDETPVIPPRYVPQAPNDPALAPYYLSTKLRATPLVGLHGYIYDNDRGELYDSGKIFNVGEQSSHGEKDHQGYENQHAFDKGEKAEHFKDNHEGHYSDEGGDKKSHSESSGHYSEYDEDDKGEKGESYGEKKYHKKGHKTSGFHNVYHKDEYKKDTDFYDVEHEGGHSDKYSSSDQHHSSADGGFGKGAHHHSGYEDHENGKAGHFNKGRESNQHKGYISENGEDSYHNNHSDYGAKKGAAGGKKYGYIDGYLRR